VRKTFGVVRRFLESDLAYRSKHSSIASRHAKGPDPVRRKTQILRRKHRRKIQSRAHLNRNAARQAQPCLGTRDAACRQTFKDRQQGQPTRSETVADDIEQMLKSAQKEVIVISPYSCRANAA